MLSSSVYIVSVSTVHEKICLYFWNFVFPFTVWVCSRHCILIPVAKYRSLAAIIVCRLSSWMEILHSETLDCNSCEHIVSNYTYRTPIGKCQTVCGSVFNVPRWSPLLFSVKLSSAVFLCFFLLFFWQYQSIHHFRLNRGKRQYYLRQVVVFVRQ